MQQILGLFWGQGCPREEREAVRRQRKRGKGGGRGREQVMEMEGAVVFGEESIEKQEAGKDSSVQEGFEQ